MSRAIRPRYYCFFDLETSGLELGHHEVIQVAAVRTDFNFQVLDEYETKVQFEAHKASERALEINHYDAAKWHDAVTWKTALAKLQGMLSLSYPAGHNITGFDLLWLRLGWTTYEHLRPARMDYHALDTMSIAWPLFHRRVVPNVKLRTLCDFFGIGGDELNWHDALTDVRATVKLAKKLLAG